MTPTYDVAIVGGGPAGLATAIAARARGLTVVVCEKQRFPIDKPCGEGLMPDAMAVLARLGVRLDEGAPFRGIRYRADGLIADATFPGGARGRGVRRTALSAGLARRAAETGVELREGVAVEGICRRALMIAGGEIEARFTVIADGLHSKLRGDFGPPPPAAKRQRFGVRRHFGSGSVEEVVEVWFGDRAEAYVTPVGSGAVGVALLFERSSDIAAHAEGDRAFDRLLSERFPRELGVRFAGAAIRSRDAGAGPFRQRVARVTAGGRTALVGDAAGYVDAVTGEGMALAFHEAEALAEAMAANDLALYERAHRKMARIPTLLTEIVLALSGRPRLRRRAILALARDPALFSRLVGLLVGETPLSRVGVARTLRFALHLAGLP